MTQSLAPQATTTSPPARRGRHRRALSLGIAGLVATALWILYGLTPFAVRASVIFYIAVGRIDCGTDSLSQAIRSTCDLVGGPLGGLFATNLPVIQSSTLLSRSTGMPPEWSYAVISWLVLFAGVFGTYRLLRLCALRFWVAQWGAIAWTGSLSVIGILGFGGMLFGAVLLPTLAFLCLSTLRALRRRRTRPALLWGTGWAALTVAMLFSDGYTFVLGSAMSGALVATWMWGRWRQAETWVGAAALAIMTGLAYALYRLVVPNAGAWGSDGIDKFRAFGLDLSTLVVPTDEVWWADLLGVGVDPGTLWGDGSNNAYNYIGVLMLILAGIGLVAHPRGRRRIVVAFALIGIAGLVLSLGPDLKIAEVYDPSLSESRTSMPPGIALLELPLEWVYGNVPGIEYMRATYRWILLFRLAVIVLAAIGVEALVRRRRRWLAIGLAVAAIVEVSFNPVSTLQTNLDRAAEVRAFNADVVTPMSQAFSPDDRIVFVSGTERANDYLSVYLAPILDVRSWNIGNDKALRHARAAWPTRIDRLIARQPEGSELRDLTASVLEDGTVTKVVVLDFDLRNSAKSWPPSDGLRDRGERISDTLDGDERFDVERHEYFDVITLAE
ncbi:hypothetical protein [Agromyces sp. GXS1127]|uniref:hypothetical protein n=1 Tax=Agromyces sp. GXS1127 TaxID=3424181 RepID=UPI003D3210B1